MTSLFGLEGKSALIVGGGPGMAEAAALVLSKVGCNSCLVDINRTAAEGVAARVSATGVKCEVVIGDITKDDKVVQIVKEAEKKMGGLDVLYTVVGGSYFKSSLEITPEEWDKQMTLNLRYSFFVAQAFAQICIDAKRPASIVCIASINGILSSPRAVAYGAAKAAMINMIKSLAAEWAKYKIRVNGVAPGMTGYVFFCSTNLGKQHHV
jgi:NAD(P)-dependent dehydrogenase (short-subunit alcohol dehydrogenase family)